MKLHNITDKLLIASVAIIIFATGFRLGQNNATFTPTNFSVTNLEERNTKNLDFSLFWETWNKLTERYVNQDALDPQAMFYGAIKGVVSSVGDPYTFFLTPKENKQSKDDLSGKFEGIGAQLGLKNGNIVIIAPLRNSPAGEAGVRSGDIILKVDNKSTEGWSLQKAVSKIRGEQGTDVVLTVFRNEEELDITITRDEIKVPSVELTFEDNVALLTLTRFGERTNADWDKAVQTIQERWKSGQISGMVLDLRDNPGGFLQSAVYIASEFLPEGKLVVKQQFSDESSDDFSVDRPGKLRDIPLVVLINQGSASASEIVAGALRDYNRAVLVGTKTFGKGSVQEALDLKGGAGLHVTIARWILPKGDWINGKGIKPEKEVKLEITDGNTRTRKLDIQLDKAIEILLK